MKKFVAALAVTALFGCASEDIRQPVAEVQPCLNAAFASPGGQSTARRLWVGNETTAAKLSDAGRLSKTEKDAYVSFRAQIQGCRLIILDQAQNVAPSSVMYWSDFFAKEDSIALALLTDQITVGQANRLAIDITGQLHAGLSQVTTIPSAQLRQQQQAEALLRFGDAMPQAPAVQTASCRWIGNRLSCGPSGW